MTITYTSFVASFPEFNSSTYPQPQVEFWIAQAYDNLNSRRFSATKLDLAASYYTAHNLVLAARNQRAASVPGGIPGAVTAPMASKAVDKVSVGYDVGAVADPNAGPYNLTEYGMLLYRMMRGVATGTYVAGPGARRAIGYGGYRPGRLC